MGRIADASRRLANGFLDLVFPRSCLGCGDDGEFVCESCRAALISRAPCCIVCGLASPARRRVRAGRTCAPCRSKTGVAVFWSPFRYEEPIVRELIHAYKYHRVRALAPILAQLMATSFERFGLVLPSHSVLAPIPMHPARQRVRGFNQSELLARELGLLLGREVLCGALARIRKAPPQVELAGEARRLNIARVFAVAEPDRIVGRTIVLVDDVKTTGTTLGEAAAALRRSGAAVVWAVTAAR